MNAKVTELARSATQSANSGDWKEAEKQWRQVVALEPAHAHAHSNLGIACLQRGEGDAALEHLTIAASSAPRDLMVLLTLAAVQRQRQDAPGERAAIDAALDVDPYFVPGLLLKGDWLERFGAPAAAAAIYTNALKISPPESNWPADFRDRLQHARNYSNRHTAAMHAHLRKSLDASIAGLPEGLAGRWREAVAIRSGTAQPQVSVSNQLYIPRLPAIPFFERSRFPFLDELEKSTDVIRGELQNALVSAGESFQPYIAYNPGEPVNQWSELNHSEKWSAYHLWRSGQPVKENLERCPQTAKILEGMSLAGISGLCPNVFFSALQPHTHIPPHHGESNARVIAHLPLVVPEGCLFRVGFETREWKVGEVLIFDDTIEHEAVNDSDELRVVLIFDLWNPLLSDVERELSSRLAAATREFAGADPA